MFSKDFARSLAFLVSSAASLPIFLVVAVAMASAQSFTDLISFSGSNGSGPELMSLVQGTDGDLYGVTSSGGEHGHGSVFKVTTSGALKTIYSFCGCGDGSDPTGTLVQGPDREFYGTTGAGGAHDAGTVFKVTSNGVLKTLHSFCDLAGCLDGASPIAGMVRGTDGAFYGTTFYGGGSPGNDCSRDYYGCGTVFKITASGELTTLYRFCSRLKCPDGDNPYSALVEGTDGNFYGTTYSGGASTARFAVAGTVFKISRFGKLTMLYSFCSQPNCSDGENPVGPLIQGGDGNLYGTTSFGGAGGAGTAFSITTAGTLTTLYSFCSLPKCADGYVPMAGLVQAADGSLYGTTANGGSNTNCGGCGTVFELTLHGGGSWNETVLYSSIGTAGWGFNGLIQATNGIFYGTTAAGGASNLGTIFSLSIDAK